MRGPAQGEDGPIMTYYGVALNEKGQKAQGARRQWFTGTTRGSGRNGATERVREMMPEADARACACGVPLDGYNRQAVSCSARCRKAAARRRRGGRGANTYDVMSLRYGRRVGLHKLRLAADRACGCGAPTAWGSCVLCTPVLFRMATAGPGQYDQTETEFLRRAL